MRLSWVGVVRPPSQAKRAYAEEPNIMMRWHVRSATWAAHPRGNAAEVNIAKIDRRRCSMQFPLFG